MKRRIGPLAAILLLAALAAYVYVYEIREKTGDRSAAGAKDRAIDFQRTDLKAIRIQNAGGVLRIENKGDTWTIAEPIAADADKDAVEGLLNSLESARVERRVGAAADKKQYGLDPPKATVTVETGSSAELYTILIGDSSPIGGSYYALLPGGTEVGVVSATLGDFIQKDLLALRDKSLLTFDAWKVKRLVLERGRETLRLEKPDDGWVFRQPVEAPADGPTITDFLNALETTRATRFDAEKPSAADVKRFGLEPPQARVTLLQEGWDVEKSVLFGKEAPGGGRYVRTVGRDPVVTVPADTWTKVTTRFFDLRRKDLLAVQQYRVETITLSRQGRPAVTLKRDKDQTWEVSGASRGKLKGASVEILLNMFSDLKATAFDDHPKQSVVSALSRKPALDVTLEEETEADAGRRKSQHLLISPPDQAGHILVRDLAWRPIAVAPAGVLQKIETQIDALLKEAAEPPAPAASPAGSPPGSPSPAGTPLPDAVPSPSSSPSR